MSMMKEFKAFVMRGNVIDLAVAVIIGTAFGKVVSSFVNDVLMPPVGLLIGGVDFSDLQIQIGKAAIKYGVFINTLIDFIIVAGAIFLVVKLVSQQKKQELATAPVTKDCPECLMAIPILANRCGHCTSILK